MRWRWSILRLIAGMLVVAGPYPAHAALFQDIERDDASAVRRALDAGEVTANATVGEPPVPMLVAATCSTARPHPTAARLAASAATRRRSRWR